MIHRKALSLMSTGEAMARVAATALSQAASQQTRPTGSTVTHNADGTQTITGPVLGTDATGTSVTTATHVGDTTPPPVPTGVRAWSGDGSLHVLWAGSLDGDVPADFDHVTVLVDGRPVAEMRSAGSVTVDGLAVGSTVSVTATAEDDACLADGTPAHNVSAPSSAVAVEIRDVADTARQNADKAIAETKDLVTLRIDSSRGTVFKNSSISTVLAVHCYKRGQELTTLTALRQAMSDSTARIRWYVLREGDTEWVSLADSDPMLSDNGFTLTVTPNDVSVKCTFKAEIITD